MIRIKCPKCEKVVWKSERFGDLYDRVDNKGDRRTTKELGIGAFYGGTYKPHKCWDSK